MPQTITTAGFDGDTVVVTTGIEAGDRVVTAGVSSLHEGMLVRPLSDTARFGSQQ